MPKKVIIPKFSKNKDFLRLYPAENIIGGSMIVKNISPENCKLSPKVYNQGKITNFAKTATRAPITMATVD